MMTTFEKIIKKINRIEGGELNLKLKDEIAYLSYLLS